MQSPPPTAPHRVLFAALMATGRALLAAARFLASRPSQAAAPARIARTLEWVEALARTLAGDRHFLRPAAYPRFPGRYPSLTAALRAEIGLPPVPPRTEAQRAAGRLYAIRKTFERDATGVIAARLARRLHLAPTDAAWPQALVAILETPAAIARKIKESSFCEQKEAKKLCPLETLHRHQSPWAKVFLVLFFQKKNDLLLL